MRWQMGRRSANVEDRRGAGPASPLGRGGVRIGGLGLVVVVVAMLLGVDPSLLLQGLQPVEPEPRRSTPTLPRDPESQRLAEFVSVVLADTEDTWKELFRRGGATYEEPRLVLFSGATESACGFAEAAVGPFYCPGDRKVYLDLDFFAELERRFEAPGDFAQAYVVAHEVGHHVQTLLGISRQVREAQAGQDERGRNRLQVMMELQADCLAGVWAHHAQRARQVLEPGDLEEGLAAAAAVGDDRIQRRTRGQVVPDAFTHGSSAQRQRWFVTGLRSGSLDACDTFNAPGL
jgi:hypothetical protein